MYGVEQVNRRTKIVQRDWDKIKKCSDIDLPDSPPAEQNILKIVCLNIFGFTAFERNGVLITDYSALLRFFSGPMVNRIIGNRNSVQIEPGLRLWSGGKPSVADFVEYLHEPAAIRSIVRNLELHTVSGLRIQKDDYNIFFIDYYLKTVPNDMELNGHI